MAAHHKPSIISWTAGEDNHLRKMLAEGETPCAIAKVLHRAESSVYRRIDTLNARNKTTKRPCMCCGNKFASEGPHNRLCNRCRNKSFSPYAH